MTTTDPTLATRQAIRSVARRVLANAAQRVLAAPMDAWEDHPDIGEDDLDAVLADVRALAERTDVQTEHYEAAYRYLARRAEGSPE